MQRITRLIPQNGIFLGLCTGYLWLVVQPSLVYESMGTLLPQTPPFQAGERFFHDCLSVPGGLVLYVTGFLSQGYTHSLLGAVLIILAAGILGWLLQQHLFKAGFAGDPFFRALPVLILVLLYNAYLHPLSACLSVAFGLGLSLAYENLASQGLAVRLSVWTVFAALGFWLAGAGAVCMLVALTVIYGLFLHRDGKMSLLAIPTGLAVMWSLSIYYFFIAPAETFFSLTPFSPVLTIKDTKVFARSLMYSLYGLVPCLVLVTFLMQRIRHRIASRAKGRDKTRQGKSYSAATRADRLLRIILKAAAKQGLLLAIGLVGLYVSHNPLRKSLVQTHCYARHHHWLWCLSH